MAWVAFDRAVRAASATVGGKNETILVNGHGLPLYYYKPDTATKSLVTGTLAQLYGKRWTLETAFAELTCHLCCEVNTLGYPKAALFGFCVAVAAYNALAVVKAALRSVQRARMRRAPSLSASLPPGV